MIQEESTTSVEHLDFDIECEVCGNPAQLYGDGHGHHVEIACRSCVGELEAQFEHWLAVQGSVPCAICRVDFTEFDKFYPTRPL